MKCIKISLLIVSVLSVNFSFAQWSADTSSIWNTNMDKNVGIGTTSPGTKLEVNGVTTIGKTYFNVLKIGPLESSPAYFYIDTKIPFDAGIAPQIHVTGYNYGNPNKALKLTIGWYEYDNRFHWAQYKSDLGYYNPSRIRLGTYDDAGTKRVRIEIANDGTYWSGYFISATDHNGVAKYYDGWNFTLGTMPAGTGDVITLSEYAGIVYSNTGNVGIGTTTPAEKLSVNGNIKAKKLIVTQTGWADYVFDKDYNLMNLNVLSAYVEQYKHLPEVPSTKQIQNDGIDVGTNQALLLKKIEELTLYIIQQHQKIEVLAQSMQALQQKIK